MSRNIPVTTIMKRANFLVIFVMQKLAVLDFLQLCTGAKNTFKKPKNGFKRKGISQT